MVGYDIQPNHQIYGINEFYDLCTKEDLESENDKLICISYAIHMCMTSNMFENYSEDNYATYNELREQILKPNIARMFELGLTNGLGPIVYDPVLFIWYVNEFGINVQNALELLMCSIDEKIRGIQIILTDNLSLPKHKIEGWIHILEFVIIYPNLPNEYKNLFDENPTYETFINRLSNDF